MTSKEALSVIRSRLDIACARAGVDNTELYNIIWEDLEVLEIIKKRIYQCTNVKNNTPDYTLEPLYPDEFDKIKEWLEK